MKLCSKCNRIVTPQSSCDDAQCPIEGIQRAAARPAAVAPPAGGLERSCPVCGSQYGTDVRFCRNDGAELVSGAPAAVPASPAQSAPVAPVIASDDAGDDAADPAEEAQPAEFAPQVQTTVAPVAPPSRVETYAEESYEPAYDSHDYFEKPRSRALPILVALLVLLSCAGGGYAYWSGAIGGRPASVAKEIEQQLVAEGFDDVAVALDKTWVATVTGTAKGEEKHNRILAIVRSNSDVVDVTDQVTVIATTSELLAHLRESLDKAGLAALDAAVNPDGKLVVTGIVNNDVEVQRLAAILAPGEDGTMTVENRTTRARAWVERDINSALSAAGLWQVSAAMVDDSTASLSGTVNDSSAVAQAARIATSNGAVRVDNRIAVQQAQAAYSAPAATQSRPNSYSSQRPQPGTTAQAPAQSTSSGSMPRTFRGTRQAQFRNGLAEWLGNVELTGGSIGSVIGKSAYGMRDGSSRVQVQCSFDLVLTAVEGSQITVEEQTRKASFACPGNKTIVLTYRGGSSLYGQWLRKKNNSVAFQAELR